ncbi:hypothetical protein HDU76_013212 [Blyttiomyces sp. JEL0837]|nr:hypothetical protein HDU76_013212 [Blyttiomyces sp. JEL0837]
MHPTDNAATSLFSPSSITDICANLQNSAKNQCLQSSADLKLISANICGNGVKEGNEQCDCGDATSCQKDPCCDGTTCKLKTGAVCDDLNDDCCSKCQLKPAGSICRSSIGVCDYSETCTGASAECPANMFHNDGEGCGGGNSCASGICTSRTQQCQTRLSNGFNTTGDTTLIANFCVKIKTEIVCSLLGFSLMGHLAGTPGNADKDRVVRVAGTVAVGLMILGFFICLIQCCCRKCMCCRAMRYKRNADRLPVVPTTSAYVVASARQPRPVSSATSNSSAGPNYGFIVSEERVSRTQQQGGRGHWVDASKYNG